MFDSIVYQTSTNVYIYFTDEKIFVMLLMYKPPSKSDWLLATTYCSHIPENVCMVLGKPSWYGCDIFLDEIMQIVFNISIIFITLFPLIVNK